MSLTRTRLAVGVAFVALVAASQASASAFYLQEQSVRGTGRAYSGEVADKGVGSLWWNPASIAGIARSEAYIGANMILVNAKTTNSGSTITRPVPVTTTVGGTDTALDPINDGLVPNLGGAWKINDKLSLGLSVAAPYNFTTEYQADSWSRYDALKSQLRTVNVDGVVAYRINEMLDLGFGVTAMYADAELTNALPNISPLQADGLQSLKGDGWAYGYTVGAQFHPSQSLTIGASYRSKIDHKLDGAVKVSGLLAPIPTASNFAVDGQAKITLPWMLNLGARWAVNDHWTLNGSVSRVGWSEFDAIRVTYTGGSSISAQDYKNVTTYAAGVDYQASPRLTLRAGVQYDPTPTPEVGRTARVPDGDRMMYATGATWAATENLKLDAALSYIAFEKSQINRTDVTATSSTVRLRGEVEGSAVVLSTGARFSF
ncbi:TonB-dependent receptor [Caulobacter sp. SL161]|uniref:outer membrane protein transport protein n=1 Tax=Caulobacter sp. SL161 TaxID=2995156 RepID=UPI0022743EF0|nr:outer membrane protein transport protein [Caulobacter sp. SL161]MCY1648061.1 TonB-dependent receptor [Caulobacter sp. SL161]